MKMVLSRTLSTLPRPVDH